MVESGLCLPGSGKCARRTRRVGLCSLGLGTLRRLCLGRQFRDFSGIFHLRCARWFYISTEARNAVDREVQMIMIMMFDLLSQWLQAPIPLQRRWI